MANETAVNFNDLLDVVRRRLLLILAVTAIGTTVAAIVIWRLPDVYDARSVVYIEPARMPGSYTRPGQLAPKLSQLVGILRQELLSRETLRSVVNDLELYPTKAAAGDAPGPQGFLERLAYVDPIEQARKDIKVDIVKRLNDDFVEISVRARGAELAARAVNRIADILASKNRELRLSQEREARAFIETQLVRAQGRLQDAEAGLARFREQNQEAYPENESQLLDRLAKLRAEVADRREGITRSNRSISETNAKIAALMSGVAPAAPSGERDALVKQLRKLEADEADLVAHGYGANWPDLVKARQLIARAKAELADLDKKPPAPPPGPAGPATFAVTDAERIRADLKARNASPELYERVEMLLVEIAVEQRTVESFERDLEAHARDLARLDLVRSSLGQTRLQLQKLQAAFDEASTEHKGLLNDLRDLEKLITAEEAGRTDQFRTIEAAEAPPLPSGPNRAFFLALALAGAAGAGFGLAYVLQMLRGNYRSVEDVEADLGLVVLAVIPQLEGEAAAPAADQPVEARR